MHINSFQIVFVTIASTVHCEDVSSTTANDLKTPHPAQIRTILPPTTITASNVPTTMTTTSPVSVNTPHPAEIRTIMPTTAKITTARPQTFPTTITENHTSPTAIMHNTTVSPIVSTQSSTTTTEVSTIIVSSMKADVTTSMSSSVKLETTSMASSAKPDVTTMVSTTKGEFATTSISPRPPSPSAPNKCSSITLKMIPPIKLLPLSLTAGFELISLNKVDEIYELVSVQANFYLQWFDECLLAVTRSSNNASNMPSFIYIDLNDDYWRPPVVQNGAIVENNMKHLPAVLFTSNGLVRQDANGECTTPCRFSLDRFPFDTQVCSFTFQLQLSNETATFTNVTARNYENSTRGIWSVDDHIETTIFQTCSKEVGYCSTGIRFTITISRKWQRYALSIFLLSSVLLVIMLSVLALSPHLPDRPIYALIILLGMAILPQTTINDLIPVTSEVMVVLIYVNFNIILCACVVIYAAVIVSVAERLSNPPRLALPTKRVTEPEDMEFAEPKLEEERAEISESYDRSHDDVFRISYYQDRGIDIGSPVGQQVHKRSHYQQHNRQTNPHHNQQQERASPRSEAGERIKQQFLPMTNSYNKSRAMRICRLTDAIAFSLLLVALIIEHICIWVQLRGQS